MVHQPDLAHIRAVAEDQSPFGRLFRLRIITAESDLLEAEINVTPELCNRNGVLHGGAVSGICDNMGGCATFMNLWPDEGTTTIEAKTNFSRPVAIGEKIRVRCVPLHKGRKTAIWQTTILRADSKVAAISTQTQLMLKKE